MVHIGSKINELMVALVLGVKLIYLFDEKIT